MTTLRHMKTYSDITQFIGILIYFIYTILFQTLSTFNVLISSVNKALD